MMLIFYYVCTKTSRMIAIRINIRRDPFATQKSQSKKCLSRNTVVMRMAFSMQTVCRTVAANVEEFIVVKFI